MISGKNPNIATFCGDNFLEVNPKSSGSILNITQENDLFDLTRPFDLNSNDGKEVFPKPGFCIKTKTNEDVKVFINMCHCEDVPKPDEKLMLPKDSDEDESIRFPLGLGLPRKEKDKSGNECICFDVVLNSDFLNTLLKDEDMRSFVLSLCIQGIADKYGIIVRDDCCLKLSKPYHGTMQRHFVKDTDRSGLGNLLSLPTDNSGSSSLIQMMESSSVEDKIPSDYSTNPSLRPKPKGSLPVLTKEKEDKSPAMKKHPHSTTSDPSSLKLPKKQKPCVQYGLFQIPAINNLPKQYALEVYQLSRISGSHTQFKVFVSNDRVVLTEEMSNFNIDISLPNPVIPDKCRANFYDGTLAVILPLAQYDDDEKAN